MSSSSAIARSEREVNRHKLLWVPRRCDLPGCTADGDSRCGRCAMVYYCSREHQATMWEQHKVECRHLASLRLVSLPYSPEEELAAHPLGSFDSLEAARLDTKCGLCGETRKDLLEVTECCGLTLCNREDEYEMMSYSREFCSRSHRRYSGCGYHHGEGHAGDWRACSDCAAEQKKPGQLTWQDFNGYCFTPGTRQQGDLYSIPCSTCAGRIVQGVEGYAWSGNMGMCCMNCANT